MSEKSRRRRWFGRSLVATTALALPLTASISYAAVQAQAQEPAAPELAEPAETAQLATPEADFVRHVGPDGKHTVRDLTPHPAQFHPYGDWDSEEFRAEMEEFQHEMEQFSQDWTNNQDWEKYGEQWAEWGRKYGEQWGKQWEEWGEQHREQALAFAEQAREQAERQREQALDRAERQREQALARAERQREAAQAWASAAPQVGVDCGDDNDQQAVLCAKRMNRMARVSLRNARNSIAGNSEIGEEVRAEVLRDLDEEIARLEREED